jgi:hypothetical protein
MPNSPRAPAGRHERGAAARRWIAIGVAIVAIAGAVVAIVLLTRDDSGPAPGSARSVPSVPRHNPTQSPPWGFNGGGWPDLCYGPVPNPIARKQQPVPDAQSCRSGSTRITDYTQIALTARAGADMDRIDASWRTIEPLPPAEAAARGAPRFNWAPLVSRYSAMLRNGIRPVVVASGAPEWARMSGWDGPGMCRVPGGHGCVFPPAPAHIPEWRAFVRGLMVHLPQMGALEVWNEPNYAKFFAPHPDPALYSRMLRAVDEAARQARFHQPIITGGLSPVPPAGGGKMPPAEFLSRVYELAGKRAFDGIGAHPYPNGPPWTADVVANLHQLRRVSARFGDGAKPLWITEIGIGGTSSGAGRYNIPLDRQGPVLARMYRAVQAMNVRSFLIYTLYDSGVPDSRFGVYGVLTPALRPKPAYCYLAQHVGGTHPCTGTGP